MNNKFIFIVDIARCINSNDIKTCNQKNVFNYRSLNKTFQFYQKRDAIKYASVVKRALPALIQCDDKDEDGFEYVYSINIFKKYETLPNEKPKALEHIGQYALNMFGCVYVDTID